MSWLNEYDERVANESGDGEHGVVVEKYSGDVRVIGHVRRAAGPATQEGSGLRKRRFRNAVRVRVQMRSKEMGATKNASGRKRWPGPLATIARRHPPGDPLVEGSSGSASGRSIRFIGDRETFASRWQASIGGRETLIIPRGICRILVSEADKVVCGGRNSRR